jgi:hypothetical protein
MAITVEDVKKLQELEAMFADMKDVFVEKHEAIQEKLKGFDIWPEVDFLLSAEGKNKLKYTVKSGELEYEVVIKQV